VNAKQDEWSNYFDEAWLAKAKEAPIDPDAPIVDPHHHLMTWPFNYEIDAWVAELKNSGHNVVATVHTEAHGHYRTDGPEHTRAAGETEYLVKAAEKAAQIPGAPKVCLGITGGGDLTVGTAKVEELLDAHTAAGKGRFRGIRINMFWGFHKTGEMFPAPGWEETAERADLAEGIACLEKRGLVLELVNHHINLPVVAKIAKKFPKLTIVSNHLATIMDRNATQAPEAELLAVWRKGVDLIAAQPNVRMKLGGCTNGMISHSMPTMRAFNKRASGAPSS
jgi:predicted TIM-barrel fold metal-dependent hydrolase